MGLPTVSVKRPVLVTVLFAGILLLGLISLFMLPVELYQGTGRGIVSIIIRARGGLAPEEVEHMITRPVEEAVSTVSRLKNMYSNSREAESRVTLEFEPGTDMKFAALEVRERFSRVKSILPEEIEKPVIANYEDSDSAILIVAITSETLAPEDVRQVVDQELKPRLDRVDGVASVEVYGGRERKILVELDRDKMYAYNISIERVMDVIGASNVSLLAGSYESGTYDFAVRTMGSFMTIDEIGDIGVKSTRQGSIIPLKEIATIKDAYLEPEDYARLNLDPNVSLYIKKVSLANTIKVSDQLKKVIDSFRQERPDLSFVEVAEKAKLIKRAIGDVRDSLFLGVLFVSLIVYIALRRVSLSFVIFVTIPISVIATFFFMDILDLSINVMTMSGLALSIGIMVDSSVVVVENVIKKLDENVHKDRAVSEGTEEVWLPLLASLMTSICVFLPVVLIDKSVQLKYQGFAFTICTVLILSFIVSVMLVPMLLSKMELGKSAHGRDMLSRIMQIPFLMRIQSFMGVLLGKALGLKRSKPVAPIGFEDKLSTLYGSIARLSFRLRYWLLLAIILIFGFSMWRVTEMDIDMPTQLDENEFQVIVFPLAGAKLETTDEAAKRLETLLHEYPEVEMISTTVQKDDLRLFVRLIPRAKRSMSKAAIMADVDERGNELIKQIHDEYSLIVDEGATSEESKKLVINIFGLENSTLEQLAHQVAQALGNVQGLTNLVMTDLRKRPEYSLIVDKGRAAFYGFSVRDIADSIHAQVRGMRPTKFHEVEKGKEIETITRLQAIYRQKVDDLRQIYLVSPRDGTQVALSQIAAFYPSKGPQSIDRKDKYRYVFVKGDVHRALESVAEDAKVALKDIEMPKDYFWRFGGQYEELMKGKSQLSLGVILSIILIYMVLACLYQSYTEPLMIMLAIPLSLIGVWAALAFTRKPLSEQVFIGMFILVGYTVNSAIILIDRINNLEHEEPDLLRRLVRAGQDRLRPILVTTISTVIGFMPMAFTQSESAELWAPLAITMIGGIVSSTILTLIIVPNFYLYFSDLKRSFKKADPS